ncbi:unnamed protein product [Closterium sp. NIES-65]|nr:unnamed protein product [Closterium sp. NIES-65]
MGRIVTALPPLFPSSPHPSHQSTSPLLSPHPFFSVPASPIGTFGPQVRAPAALSLASLSLATAPFRFLTSPPSTLPLCECLCCRERSRGGGEGGLLMGLAEAIENAFGVEDGAAGYGVGGGDEGVVAAGAGGEVIGDAMGVTMGEGNCCRSRAAYGSVAGGHSAKQETSIFLHLGLARLTVTGLSDSSLMLLSNLACLATTVTLVGANLDLCGIDELPHHALILALTLGHQPCTITDAPSPMPHHPCAITHAPSPMRHHPCAINHAPSPMRHHPCAMPSPMRHHPCAITHAPSPVRHHPCAITHAPSPVCHHPCSITRVPSPMRHHPCAITHAPSPVCHHPCAITRVPSPMLHRPCAITHAPSPVRHHPCAITRVPSPMLHHPCAITHAPSTCAITHSPSPMHQFDLSVQTTLPVSSADDCSIGPSAIALWLQVQGNLSVLPDRRLVTASWYAPSEANTSSTGPMPVNVDLVASSDASDSSVASTCSGSGESAAAIAKSLKPAPPAVHAPPAHRAAVPPVAPRACRRPLVLSAYDGVLDPELFEKTGELGCGGFGTVVVMRRVENGEVVAVKRVERKQLVAVSNEAMLSASLSECPSVLGVREVHLGEQHAYMLSDVCSGSDLRALMQRRKAAASNGAGGAGRGKGKRWWGKAGGEGGRGGGMTEVEALEVVKHVGDAVAFCHERGVVHCDVKPDNILFSTPTPLSKPLSAPMPFSAAAAPAAPAAPARASPAALSLSVPVSSARTSVTKNTGPLKGPRCNHARPSTQGASQMYARCLPNHGRNRIHPSTTNTHVRKTSRRICSTTLK